MSALPPWVDLPTPLTEKILERLPLSDYVRFPAVCRGWRSIQADHRRRHAPSPPPMLNLPWIIAESEAEEEAVSCYSPFEDRSYRIPNPNQRPKQYSHSFANGWLLRRDAIVNPISGAVIPFPYPFSWHPMQEAYTAAVSPPPDHAVFFVLKCGGLHLCRQGVQIWTHLMLPMKKEECTTVAIAFGGKLYCICSRDRRQEDEARADHLVIIDALQEPPAVSLYRMAELSKTLLPDGAGLRFRWHPNCLVESGGEVLLIRGVYKPSFQIVGYQVFRPDLVKRTWTRVESLGNRLLFLHDNHCVSLLAADVGLKENCIYSSKFHDLGDEQKHPWIVFDLGAGMMTEVAFRNVLLPHRRFEHMFVPCIH